MHKTFKSFQKWSGIFTVITFFYLITQTDCYEIAKQRKAIKVRHVDSGYVSFEAQPGAITPLPEDICTPGNDEIPFDFKPLCARTGQKSFCNFPDYYPTKFIAHLEHEYKSSIASLIEDINEQKAIAKRKNSFTKCMEKDACKVEAEIIRPGWVNESGTGNWIIVLNDKANRMQEIGTNNCSEPVRECSFISPLYNESCKQMCCTHKLVTAYPCERNRTPKVSAVEFPIPCS